MPQGLIKRSIQSYQPSRSPHRQNPPLSPRVLEARPLLVHHSCCGVAHKSVHRCIFRPEGGRDGQRALRVQFEIRRRTALAWCLLDRGGSNCLRKMGHKRSFTAPGKPKMAWQRWRKKARVDGTSCGVFCGGPVCRIAPMGGSGRENVAAGARRVSISGF